MVVVVGEGRFGEIKGCGIISYRSHAGKSSLEIGDTLASSGDGGHEIWRSLHGLSSKQTFVRKGRCRGEEE